MISRFSTFMRCSSIPIDDSTTSSTDIASTPCSGRGDCLNGTCLCEIRYSGDECTGFNLPYHAGKTLLSFCYIIQFFILEFLFICQFFPGNTNPHCCRKPFDFTRLYTYWSLLISLTLTSSAYTDGPTILSDLRTTRYKSISNRPIFLIHNFFLTLNNFSSYQFL